MKELVIVSKNKAYIKEIERYFQKIKKDKIYLLQKIEGKNETKLGIAYFENFDIIENINIPLKRCFKKFKRKFFYDLDLEIDIKEINKFVNLNIDREFNICFKEIKIIDKLYIDSLFSFLTKEVKESWNKIGLIIKENVSIFGINKEDEKIIKFTKKETKDNEK
ncbi:MAG: hypothetical protein IJW82_00735 [Clostridia bacterium]|nr:hypothetical protein [Clostridia bacterium]